MDQPNQLLPMPPGDYHDSSPASGRELSAAVAAQLPATQAAAGVREALAPVPATNECGTDQMLTAWYQSFPKLVGLAKRKGLPQHVVEDLVQDAYVKLLQRRDSLPPIRSPAAYLRSMVINGIFEFFRTSSPACELSDDLPAAPHRLPIPEAVCPTVDFRAFTRDYPEQALALECWASGWTAEELGQALGRTPGAIREYLRQCRI
jgi:DNA-directed RNA polymerase specialized sigma24 family protein